MKKIYFKQQRPLDYMPLRAGLGYITPEELWEYKIKNSIIIGDRMIPSTSIHARLCPKIYTTRTHRLEGEYYVVEGSRFKAKPVEPRIEFKATSLGSTTLNIKELVRMNTSLIRRGFEESYPEYDLGIKHTTFDDLRNELLRLIPKATLKTPFWINKLEPIGGK